MGGLNFYKGFMFGGVPKYFHPFGAWHTAWTQRSETVTRFALKVIPPVRRTVPPDTRTQMRLDPKPRRVKADRGRHVCGMRVSVARDVIQKAGRAGEAVA